MRRQIAAGRMQPVCNLQEDVGERLLLAGRLRKSYLDVQAALSSWTSWYEEVVRMLKADPLRDQKFLPP